MDDRLLTAVAEAVGTPVYVYDAAVIRGRYAALAGALAGRVRARIHYSVKANSTGAVLRLLRELGAGADIVSGGELQRARAAGFAPRDIVFSGVGKTDGELGAAIDAGIGLLNVESESEAERLIGLATDRGVRARVGIRVNPDVTADTHPYTVTGTKGVKFGVPVDRVVPLALRLHAAGSATLVGLGMHIGSQIVSGEPYRSGGDRLAEIVEAVRAAGVDTLEVLDVGGGLGIAYDGGEGEMDPAVFAAAVEPLARATGLPIACEPGRFLVGTAGVLLARVTDRKVAGGRTIIVTDAGMNDLLRPSLYQAAHPVRALGAPADAAAETVDVVGPVCETGDFLALDRPVAGAVPGAVLAVGAAGAYGFSMSSQYNSRPRPAEVLVDGERWGVIRERETFDDLVRGEVTPPRWMHEGHAA